MDRAYFEKSFTYNRESNKALITPYLSADPIPERAQAIISHILQAQKIWLYRLDPEQPPASDPWEKIEPNDWLYNNDETYYGLLSVIRNEGADRRITYQNSKMATFENNVSEILHHLLYHGAYHRGQLALILRQEGHQPPVSDFIYYLRE